MLFYRDENKNNFLPVGSGNVWIVAFFLFVVLFMSAARLPPFCESYISEKREKRQLTIHGTWGGFPPCLSLAHLTPICGTLRLQFGLGESYRLSSSRSEGAWVRNVGGLKNGRKKSGSAIECSASLRDAIAAAHIRGGRKCGRIDQP